MPLMPGFLRVKRLMVLRGGPGWLGVSRAACSVLLLLLLPSLPRFFFPVAVVMVVIVVSELTHARGRLQDWTDCCRARCM